MDSITKVGLVTKNLILAAEKIVVIGLPATGKTYLAERLAKLLPEHRIYHTDDYAEQGYKESLYSLINDVYAGPGKYIVEGVQGYRFLRKNQENSFHNIDLIIEVVADSLTRVDRYIDRGKEMTPAFDKNLQTVMAKYLDGQRFSHLRKPMHLTLNSNALDDVAAKD